MAGRTNISWTDASWNPTTGCTKLSPGCSRCYAESIDHRFDNDKVGKLPWAFPPSIGGRGITFHPDRLELPLRWDKPRKIFVNSMSDLFHEDVPFEFTAQVWDVMRRAYWHTFQILTKRPGRMHEFVHTPLPNVWLGVSTENQLWADRRIPLLVQCPAAIRFISYEPALGPLDLTPWLGSLSWVVYGGESGPLARPPHPDWFRSIRDQCQSADIAQHFKQWGEWLPAPEEMNYSDAEFWADGRRTVAWSSGHTMVRVGKKAAGNHLDGRQWLEWPNA